MRDPSRIDNYCNEFATLWHKLPDWRFLQLIMNFLSKYDSVKAFYMEDENFINLLKDYIKEYTNEL